MRMVPITAIAWLTVRDAIRSRLLVSMTAVLVIGVISLPLLITGDNSLQGRLQVILNYTLTFTMAMLSAVTLWAACGGISSEIQDRRLYLVLTKPVHRYELWLGKWLGIVGINAILLCLSGVMICGLTWHTLHVASDSDDTKRRVREQYLLSRISLSPEEPDWTQRATQDARTIIQSGRAPAGMDARMIQSELMNEYRKTRFTLPPGGTIRFAFQLPGPDEGRHDLLLNYTFNSSRPERTPVPAEWTITVSQGRDIVLAVTNYPGLPNAVLIPAALSTGSRTVELAYHRLDTGNPATLMMATGGTPPELLIASGRGEPNLARGLLIILFRLAFLAALGLTAGSLLSMPVAVFVSFFILIVLALSGYVESVATSGVFFIPHEGEALAPTWMDALVLRLFKAFNVITQPILRFDPVPLLKEGRQVSWSLTAQAALWMVGLYTTLTALIGIRLFSRRELG